MSERRSRRRFLQTLGSAVAIGLAGCLADDAASDGSTPTTRPATGSTRQSPLSTTGQSPPSTTDQSPASTTSDGAPATPDGSHPTVTERNPRPLDVSGSWTQAGGGPTRSGVTTATGVPHDGQTYWQRRRVRSGPPALADGRLFHYAKLGADTSGRPTVTRTRKQGAGTAHPVYGDPYLVARSASDGHIEWSQSLPTPGHAWPAVGGDRVVSGVTGELTAFDVAGGRELWTADIGESSPGTPAVVDDTVVVPVDGVVGGEEDGDDDGDGYVRRPSVVAYDLADGSERWSVQPPKRSNGVAIAGETVVVLSADYEQKGTVLGLSLTDGTEQWRTTVPGAFFDLPVVGDGAVYVTGSANQVFALDPTDGTERWSKHVGGQPVQVAAANGTVYLGVDRRALALAASDGSRQWSVTAASGESEEYAQGVAVGSDAVYVGMVGVEAGLYALDRADGTERWHHTFPNAVIEGDIVRSGLEAQPVVVSGGLYAYAADGLYAFGPRG